MKLPKVRRLRGVIRQFYNINNFVEIQLSSEKNRMEK